MSLILNIDTASSIASVSISLNGKALANIDNKNPNEHAAFLQPAIKKLLAQASIHLDEIDAVAVVNGPGSYTGLRVGLASAKGICFALNKPLITIGSLPLMAKAAVFALQKEGKSIPLLCPMIDARRMEVFTAVYNSDLKEIFSPHARILSYDSFVEESLQDVILFFGNGAAKFKAVTTLPNALFTGSYDYSAAIYQLSDYKFSHNEFTPLAYSEPLYGKEFYSG
jgi:tRNA threonylcarbamoyladenosine biosynthesis protein TsaB